MCEANAEKETKAKSGALYTDINRPGIKEGNNNNSIRYFS